MFRKRGAQVSEEKTSRQRGAFYKAHERSRDGQAFHRRNHGPHPQRGLKTDFYIGAQAAVRGYALLTRDARRYRTYFPKLKLIVPE